MGGRYAILDRERVTFSHRVPVYLEIGGDGDGFGVPYIRRGETAAREIGVLGVEGYGGGQLELKEEGGHEVIEIQGIVSGDAVVDAGDSGDFIEANMTFLYRWK